jgi:two-component system response regulator AtoC
MGPRDRTVVRGRRDAAGRVLLVIRNGTSVPRPLPATGTWLIGRAPSADVPIMEASVSRRQALLHLGPRLTVQDLGSANGTRLGERELRGGDPVAVQPGEPIEIGGTLLVVAAGAAEPRPTAARSDDGPLIAWDRGTPAMRELLRTVDKVARGEINVLVLGETGVGKDVVAREVHRRSRRATGPFLRINCATLSEHLLESELFGHERGAFTGAVEAKAGLLETAAGGTVFLDEVGELPRALQARLLLVLEERRARRVGGLRDYPVDVRFIAATNRDLRGASGGDGFRSDLFFRLDGVSLRVPPLRERPDEVLALAGHFLARAGGGERWLSDTAVAALQGWAWPGNVRELRNVIERAVLLATGPVIARAHLRLEGTPAVAEGPVTEAADPEGRLVQALTAAGWNQTRAAAALGIARNTLIARMRKYGLRGPRAAAR